MRAATAEPSAALHAGRAKENARVSPEWDLDLLLAVLGVAQVATEELLAAQLGLRTFEEIKEDCAKSVYWP